MQMTNSEIYKSYQQATRKKTQIRILAELNACNKQQIQEIIDIMEQKKRGRPKREAVKTVAGTMPEAVLAAVRKRVEEIEQHTQDLKQIIERYTETVDTMMSEWAELKEWQQEHDQEGRTCKQ